MARFPQTEPEIAALAHVVAQGLKEAVEDFPAPPSPPGPRRSGAHERGRAKTTRPALFRYSACRAYSACWQWATWSHCQCL